MEVNFDQYIRNFRIFYQQLVKGHKDQQNLHKNIKLLLENQARKWKRSMGFNKKIIQEAPQTQSLKKVRQLRRQKQKATINVEAMYTSKQIQNCIVFGYFYLIFETKNVACYELLTQTLSLFHVKSDLSTPQLKRKLAYAWTKFDEFMYNKKIMSIRYDKLLIDYFKDFPQFVLDYIFQTLFSKKSIVEDKKTQFFQEIATQVEIKIIYFQINGSNIKVNEYGPDRKTSLKIGYYIKQQKYINVMKIPEKQQKQIKNQKTSSKFLQISKKLQEMYTKNQPSYLNLNNIKNKSDSQFMSKSKFKSSIASVNSRNSFSKNSNFTQMTSNNSQTYPTSPTTPTSPGTEVNFSQI